MFKTNVRTCFTYSRISAFDYLLVLLFRVDSFFLCCKSSSHSNFIFLNAHCGLHRQTPSVDAGLIGCISQDIIRIIVYAQGKRSPNFNSLTDGFLKLLLELVDCFIRWVIVNCQHSCQEHCLRIPIVVVLRAYFPKSVCPPLSRYFRVIHTSLPPQNS